MPAAIALLGSARAWPQAAGYGPGSVPWKGATRIAACVLDMYSSGLESRRDLQADTYTRPVNRPPRSQPPLFAAHQPLFPHPGGPVRYFRCDQASLELAIGKGVFAEPCVLAAGQRLVQTLIFGVKRPARASCVASPGSRRTAGLGLVWTRLSHTLNLGDPEGLAAVGLRAGNSPQS